MSDKLELRVVFAAVDNFLRPVKRITDGARAASKELAAAKEALKGLNAQQKLIDGYRSTNKALGINAQDLAKARAEVKRMAEAMAATPVPTVAMQRAFAKATEEARGLAAAETRLLEKKQRLRRELTAAGIDTKQLASQQRDLKSRMDAATAAVTKQSQALEAANKRMQRMHAARAEFDKTNALRNKLAGAGAGITAGGVAVGLPIAKATNDFKEFEMAMLGVARQVEGARDENGQLTATYHEIGDAAKAMSERLPLAANDIAAIVADGARMGIQGKENLIVFADTAAVMADAFELPVDQVGDDIGKISQLYKVPIKDIMDLGDAINWLDDNAQSSGRDIIEVMKRIAGNATTVGMGYKEAAALGSTYLSLGASAEVAASASNAMIRELSVATMQSKRFREGAAMLKLDLKELQKSASTDATGTIIRIMEAINQLPKEQQLEAATRLFGKEFGDDAAKLANNLEEYRRQLALMNDEKARGSMRRESDARNETLDAQMAMTKNALTNLSSDLGEHLKPGLVGTLKRTREIIQAMRAWADENPRLAGGIVTVVKWLAVGITVIGGLMLAAAAVLGPLALLKFSLTTLGISGGVAAGALAVVKAAALVAGNAIGAVFSLIRAHPFALIAAAGAYAIGFLITKWSELKELFIAGDWSGIGMLIMQGLESGLDAMTLGLYSKVKGIVSGMVDAAKKVLDVRSPSRVFSAIGAFTMQGLEQGLAGSESGPLKAVGDMAKKLAGIGAGVVIGGTAVAGQIPLDTRPPLSAQASAGGLAPMQVTIQIYGAPGQGTGDIRRQVEEALASIEAKRAAQHRSRLRDSE